MIGVDIVFIEALPAENMSAAYLAELGLCTVAYPWTLVDAN